MELTVNGSVEQIFIDGLHPGVTYNFTVLAFNGEGDSGRSEPFSQRILEEGEKLIFSALYSNRHIYNCP